MNRMPVGALLVSVLMACLVRLSNAHVECHFDFRSFWRAGSASLQGGIPYGCAVIQDILYPRKTANIDCPVLVAVVVGALALLAPPKPKDGWLTA